MFFCTVILTELSMFCVRLSHFIIKFDLSLIDKWTKMIKFSGNIRGTITVGLYKQQQHSKLLAQFVFKVSAFHFNNTRTKSRAVLADCYVPITH